MKLEKPKRRAIKVTVSERIGSKHLTGKSFMVYEDDIDEVFELIKDTVTEHAKV